PSNGIGNSAFKRNFPFVAAKVSRRRYRNASLALRARLAPSAFGGGFTATSTNRFARGESTPSRTRRRTLAAYWLFHSGSIGSGTSAGQPGTALPGSCIL